MIPDSPRVREGFVEHACPLGVACLTFLRLGNSARRLVPFCFHHPRFFFFFLLLETPAEPSFVRRLFFLHSALSSWSDQGARKSNETVSG